MEINKIYDVLKSKYDIVDYDEFTTLMDGLRKTIKYFIEFSFDDENIWCKLSFKDAPDELKNLLIQVFIAGNQFSKDNIKNIEDYNKKLGTETKGIILSFRLSFISGIPPTKPGGQVIQNITIPLTMLYLSKEQAQDGAFVGIMQILFNELVKLRTEIENQKNEIQLKDNTVIELKNENKALREQNEQLTLFPDFSRESAALIKKQYFKSFLDHAYFNYIETTYPERLNNKLIGNLTVKDILDENRTWLNALNLKDLENYIKLFAFINLVKDKGKKYLIDFKDLDKGRYMIRVVTDNNFYKHFLRKKPLRKDYEGYDGRDKKALLKWLYENRARRRTIFEGNGNLHVVDVSLYEMIIDDNQDDLKTMGLIVNTNFIPDDMKDYFKIPTRIFDDIDDQVENIKQTVEYKDINKLDYISNYEIFILRFYILLLNIVTPHALTKSKNGYITITQTLKQDNFYIRMGNPKTIIKQNLIKRGKIRAASDKQTETEKKFLIYILDDFVFKIAINLKWITSKPEKSGDNVTFKINPYQFKIGRAHV